MEAIPSALDLNLPVVFHGQTVKVLQVDEKALILDEPVQCKAGLPLVITQRALTADNRDMQELVASAWGHTWNREAEDDCREKWATAMQSLECLPDTDAFEPTPLSVAQWDKALKCIPKKSARGADAFTPFELRILPDSLKHWLFRLFGAIEGSGHWPQRLTAAKVVVLSKGDKPATSPLDCRPITILSRIYRTWAKICAAEVVTQLVSSSSIGATGASAGLSADMVVARTMFVVEEATENNREVFGLVIDLVKCFNRIPRIPLLTALLWMGVPVCYLLALGKSCCTRLQDMLRSLTRWDLQFFRLVGFLKAALLVWRPC